MIVLGIDPGAAGAGYCVWDSELKPYTGGGAIYIGATPPTFPVDVAVVESGFIGRMGLKSMWGLGFSAGSALAWVHAQHAFMHGRNVDCYTIRPDGPLGWRAALPVRDDLPPNARFARYDGLPGDVIVARLRLRYGLTDLTSHTEHTEHKVEACGIAEAAAAILARPKATHRRALKAVKR